MPGRDSPPTGSACTKPLGAEITSRNTRFVAAAKATVALSRLLTATVALIASSDHA